MKLYLLIFPILLLTATGTFAQTSPTVFLKYRDSETSVPKDKANFSRTTTQREDGSITTDVRDLQTDKIVKSETLKGKEPFGKWIIEDRILDYDFDLTRATGNCTDEIPGLKRAAYLEDNDSLGYKAPVLVSKKTFTEYLHENICYPRKAMEENISGTVYLNVTISNSGTVEDVSLVRGIDILLDKEAARLVRGMIFSSPAILNGHPKQICFLFPLKFRVM
jgi:TonB family protein